MAAPYSGRVIDYLGSGLLAARPAAPNLFPDTVGLYYCTDVGSEKLTAWDGLAWADIAGGGGSGTVTSVGLTTPDIFTVSGSPVTTSGTVDFTPVDPGADRIVFWDDSASKWQYLTLGTNLSITGTTLDAAGGGGSAAWGAITGTLSDQTDLQAALDAKAAVGVPQNSQSTAYTLVLADANKHILHPSADTTARTMTIPANSSVAYPVGTTLTFVNQNAAGVMTIAITTDTMRLAGAGTTGSRTLAANGIATALKLTSTEWIINGTGLT